VGTRCADHVTPLYPQKLALTSPTGGGRSVCIVRSRTKAMEFSFLVLLYIKNLKLFCSFCTFFWPSFRPKSDQHPVTNPQYTFSSPATVPTSHVGQFWSQNSPTMNKCFELSLSLWGHVLTQNTDAVNNSFLAPNFITLLLTGRQNCWYSRNPEVLHKVSAGAPWHTEFVLSSYSLYVKRLLEITFRVQFYWDVTMCSMVKRFAMFWRKNFALVFRQWGFQGEYSTIEDDFS